MARTQSDSTRDVVASTSTSGEVTDVDIREVSREVPSDWPLISVLPVNDGRDAPINWLGSSYSGVDIKVVAHLYGERETTEYEALLSEHLDQASELQNAYQTLVGSTSQI